jgi:GNAT superfamily N-acetyltransferase
LNLASAAEVRLVAIDDLSAVRAIHAGALGMLAAGSNLGKDEIDTVAKHPYSASYSEHLTELVSAQRLLGAWVGGQLAGTCGWSPGDDVGKSARIGAVLIGPAYTRGGLGRLLTLAAEGEARRAGFDSFQVRAAVGVEPFYARLGYRPVGQGALGLLPQLSIIAVFMRKSGDA